ncbi:MAG: DUF5132 domain-containing protein [Methylocapsa sp.]|nr:DUF5132 domain-containing protein [Methylocapsa sp.]
MARSSTRNLFLALIAGAIGGAIVPSVGPAVARIARPASKRAIRAGLRIYEQACQTFAEWSETASDLMAEVQSEIEQEQQNAAAPESKDGDQVVPFDSRPAADERRMHA